MKSRAQTTRSAECLDAFVDWVTSEGWHLFRTSVELLLDRLMGSSLWLSCTPTQTTSVGVCGSSHTYRILTCIHCTLFIKHKQIEFLGKSLYINYCIQISRTVCAQMDFLIHTFVLLVRAAWFVCVWVCVLICCVYMWFTLNTGSSVLARLIVSMFWHFPRSLILDRRDSV